MNSSIKDKYYFIKLTLAFGAIYIFWGTNYLGNAIALKSFSPFVLVTSRYFFAGCILAIYAFYKKLTWPSRHDIKVMGVSGILMLGLGSGMVALAQLYISSGYAAAVTATESLWFVILDRKRWPYYFSNPYIIGGLVAGLGGIFYFSYLTNKPGEVRNWLGTIIILAGAIIWVAGALFMQYNLKGKSSTVTTTAIQLFAASGISSIVALFRGEWSDLRLNQVSQESWAALFYLVVLGSLIAFSAYNWLIRVQPPAVVSTHAYVNPIVAIFAGWLFEGERITIEQSVVYAGVLLSVLVVQWKKPK